MCIRDSVRRLPSHRHEAFRAEIEAFSGLRLNKFGSIRALLKMDIEEFLVNHRASTADGQPPGFTVFPIEDFPFVVLEFWAESNAMIYSCDVSERVPVIAQEAVFVEYEVYTLLIKVIILVRTHHVTPEVLAIKGQLPTHIDLIRIAIKKEVAERKEFIVIGKIVFFEARFKIAKKEVEIAMAPIIIGFE